MARARRIWVQAFRLEADGTSTVIASVSEDSGATFTAQPALAHLRIPANVNAEIDAS